jgi:hypothetical protein
LLTRAPLSGIGSDKSVKVQITFNMQAQTKKDDRAAGLLEELFGAIIRSEASEKARFSGQDCFSVESFEIR